MAEVSGQNLSKRFADVCALREVSFEVSAGGVLLVVDLTSSPDEASPPEQGESAEPSEEAGLTFGCCGLFCGMTIDGTF